MDVYEISKEIRAKVKLLETGRNLMKERSKLKAETMAEYEKEIAITILKLRNGVEMKFEGQVIVKTPVTVLDKIAKGICWRERLAMDMADNEFRAAIIGMKAIETEMTGLQSINKYFDKVEK